MFEILRYQDFRIQSNYFLHNHPNINTGFINLENVQYILGPPQQSA